MKLRSQLAKPPESMDGASVRIASKDDFAPLADYVDKEVAAAWLRKNSFETRAFSLVTLNVGAVTLYFALVTNFGLHLTAIDRPSKTFLVLVIVSAAMSIIAAAFSALPANYPTLDPADLDGIFNEVLG
jgi:hypothetical protein